MTIKSWKEGAGKKLEGLARSLQRVKKKKVPLKRWGIKGLGEGRTRHGHWGGEEEGRLEPSRNEKSTPAGEGREGQEQRRCGKGNPRKEKQYGF